MWCEEEKVVDQAILVKDILNSSIGISENNKHTNKSDSDKLPFDL